MKITFQKEKVFYSNKERYLKLYTETPRQNNLMILYAEESKLPYSLDLALEGNFKTIVLFLKITKISRHKNL